MKVKFANRIYEVLFTKELAGLTMYAVEDEPNHIDWLINVEVVDADKKELKKIEPTDKYEGLTDFERTLADICIGWIGEEIGQKEYIKDNADVLLKIAIKKFNSVQDAPFEQNSAWSEEDENMLKSIIATCELAEQDRDSSPTKHLLEMQTNWLKSLKDRVQSQPKQEWSEEDENRINRLIAYFEDKESFTAEDDIVYANWLKSLRPQKQWKPTDEQMNAFDAVLVYNPPCSNECRNHLITLYNDLKKLK